MKRISLVLALGAALGMSLCASTTHAGFQQTYIAVGDSLAFGTGQDQFAPSDGDRGYVFGLGNRLTFANGGTRPDVINLAIPGETSGSFLGIAPNYSSPFAYTLNTHYPFSNPPTQRDFLLSTIASETTAGRSVTTISLQLGANDLFALAASPAFQAADPADQVTMIQSMFGTLGNNYVSILADIHNAAPDASLILLGYYNPYTPYLATPADPRYPYAVFAQNTIPALNSLIQQLSGFVPNTTFIDIAPLFVGHETEYTYIADPDMNVHPNAAGYGAITGALSAVPEPSSFAMMGLGGIGIALLSRRLRRKTA